MNILPPCLAIGLAIGFGPGVLKESDEAALWCHTGALISLCTRVSRLLRASNAQKAYRSELREISYT